jgi:hypothetical protein
LTGLPTAWRVKHYDQFASVALNPNSLYWIEVSVHSASEESVIEWGTTADISGPDVAGNYSAWSLTDDGFFRNKGIDPFAFDSALQMEVDVVPEPSTWAMMVLGFAGLGSTRRLGRERRLRTLHRQQRKRRPQSRPVDGRRCYRLTRASSDKISGRSVRIRLANRAPLASSTG